MREVHGRVGVLVAGPTAREAGPFRRVSARPLQCRRHARPRLPRWRTSSRCCARVAASGPRWPSSHGTGGVEETVHTGEAQADLIAGAGIRDGRTAVGGRDLLMVEPLIMAPVVSRGRTPRGPSMAVEVQGSSTAHELHMAVEVQGSSTAHELHMVVEVQGSSTAHELHMVVEVQGSSTAHGLPTVVEVQDRSTAREGTTVVEGRERLTADEARTAVEGTALLAAAMLRRLRVEDTRGIGSPATAGAALLPWSPTCPAVSLRNREAPPRSRERLALGGAPR